MSEPAGRSNDRARELFKRICTAQGQARFIQLSAGRADPELIAQAAEDIAKLLGEITMILVPEEG